MKRLLIIIATATMTIPCYSQWNNGGWNVYDAGNVLAFGVHDTTLFMADSAAGTYHLVYRFNPYGSPAWVATDNGLDPTQGYVASFASLGKYLFAGQGNGPANVSTDNGGHWTSSETASPIASNGRYLFSQYVAPSQIVRSVDSGKNWEVKANYPVSSYASIGTFIFANTGSSLLRSTDTGNDWSQIHPPFIGVMTAMDTLLFIVGNGQIAKSTDSGSSWSMVPVDSAGDARYVNVLATDGKNLFAGTGRHGLLVSTDVGKTWQSHNAGLVDAYHNNTLSIISLGVFDTLLFADEDCWHVDHFYAIYYRPISQLTRPPDAVQPHTVPGDTIEVFPDPTTSQVSIRSGGTPILGVEVLNVLGEKVLSTSSSHSSDISLDLSKLPSGTYFVQIETQNGIVLRKVIRE